MIEFAGKSLSIAVKGLVSVEHFRAASIVSMPHIYPSGASVVLEISEQSGRVFISDRGGGYQEAEYLGAIRQFTKEAPKLALEAGIGFDGRDMFVAEVPMDAITGAMAVVASGSANAAVACALNASEREERYAKEILFDKLSEIYGSTGFERDVPLLGASNHQWRVDAVVRQHPEIAIFNSVTNNYISAAGTAAKFHDFSRLERVPRRIAVVVNKKEVGDWIGVLASASDFVLEVGAANDKFFKAAKVA